MKIDSFGIIKIIGPDAKKFLQGQLTCNMDSIQPSVFYLAAHCNPQGRIISLFHLVNLNDAYYFVLPPDMVELTITSLKKYIVFYKAKLNDASSEVLPINMHQLTKSQLISNGIPTIYHQTSGKFLPHELNLPELGAISFDKGCYTGQEIIARMHYRGKLKTHLYLAELENMTTLAPGTDIFCLINGTATAVGTIVDSDIDEYNKQRVLFVTDETHANDRHLFVGPDAKNYLIMRN